MSTTEQLLGKYPIISEQIDITRLSVVLGEAEAILRRGLEGNLVEFGCYIGTSSLFLRRLLDQYGQSNTRDLHVYDSFEGLPEKSRQDASPTGEQFKVGELSVSKKSFINEFKKCGLQIPIIHRSWFADLGGKDIPQPIAFAFLDGDFYQSIIDSLQLIWSKMAKDSTIVVDDFSRESLPGVEKAVNDFLRDKSYRRLHADHHIGIIEL